MPPTLEELAGRPSAESWRLLCEALAALPEDEGARRAAALEPLLSSWDEELRATMCGMDWDDRFFEGRPDPRSSVVRFLRYDRFFSGRYGGMMMRGRQLTTQDLRRLASTPGVARLTRVDLSYSVDSAGLAELARSPHFTSLRTLKLAGCHLDGAAIAALAAAPFFAQLTHLGLGNNALGAREIEPLLARADVALHRLDLWNNPLAAGGGRALAAAACRDLVELSLVDCSLGTGGARALSAHAGPELDELDVSQNTLGDEGLRELVSGPLRARALRVRDDAVGARGLAALRDAAWPLRELTLTSNALGDDAVAALGDLGAGLAVLALADNDLTGAGLAALLGDERLALTSLDVSGNRVGPEGMRRLGPTMRALETLRLDDNRIGDEGVECLAGARADALRTLSLARNAVTPRALETLSGAPWFGALTSLDVSDNPALGAVAGLVLGARHLESLSLRGCALGDDGAAALAAASFRPTNLDLGACELGDAALEALCASPVLSRVETLRLSDNRITDRGVRALVRSPHTGALKELFVENNRLGDDGAIALAGWAGPLAFHTDGNPHVGERGNKALEALPRRCCP